MKAAVTTKAGDPDVIEIQEVPQPEIRPGWMLIKVKAFGLNRSELFIRRGILQALHFHEFKG